MDKRRELIAHVVTEHNPHVIGWQEIREKWEQPGSNQLTQLAKIIPGYQYLYEVASRFSNEEEGLGLFIKEGIQILEHKVWQLPLLWNCSDRNQRILFNIKLNVNGRIVNFANTHWSYLRECQIGNAIDAWNILKDFEDFTIIVGDFNTYEDFQIPAEFFTGKVEINGFKGDFRDTWLDLEGNRPGHTFSSWEPITRADRIFSRKFGLKAKQMERVGMVSIDGLYPSDHLGLVALFEDNT